jgi:hypothetical protein
MVSCDKGGREQVVGADSGPVACSPPAAAESKFLSLGHYIPWCTGFPFTVCAHPQYVGTVMSIWGVFLLFRYPEMN